MDNNTVIHRDMGESFFWENDLTTGIHMIFSAELDREIDGETLLSAVNDTLSTYPLLRDSLVEKDGRLYFTECDSPVEVYNSPRAVAPLSPRCRQRTFTVNYFENKITFSAAHSIFDGGGFIMLIKHVLRHYMERLFGESFEVPGIRDKIDGDYFEDNKTVDLGEYVKTPMISFPDNAYTEPLFKHGANGEARQAEICVPSEEFMSFCRECGASPSVMLFLIFAKTVYRLRGGEAQRVTSVITVDIRKELGLEHSIFVNSASAFLSLSAEELASQSYSQLAPRLRSMLKTQLEHDYMRTFAQIMRDGAAYEFSFTHTTATNTYMGRVDFGDCGKHIRRISSSQNQDSVINMFEMNGSFIMTVLLGEGTEVYTKALVDEMSQNGLSAKITLQPGVIPLEVK